MRNVFKEKEQELRTFLPARGIFVLRADGKAFHSFTKQFARPYDFRFMEAMDATAKSIVKNVFPGALFAYVQSDEVSVAFSDLTGERTQLPFGGRCDKLLSVSASAATFGIMESLKTCEGVPLFDARLMIMDSVEQLEQYVHWRRYDARKNSITMAATEVARGKMSLENVSTRERHALLEGTDYEMLPNGFFHGRFVSDVSTPATLDETMKTLEHVKTLLQ